MTVTIQLKRGSGAPRGLLADGEPAWDHTNHVLYVGTGAANFAVGGTPFTAEDAQDAVGAILTDTATIDLTYDDGANTITADVKADSVGVALMHASATDVLFGRSSAGAGAGQEVACTAFARTILDDADAAAVRATIGAAASSGAYQPLDDTLTSLAALNVTAGNQMIVSSGADSFVVLPVGANTFPARSSAGNVAAKALTDFALTLLDDADAAAARATLGVGSGTGTVTSFSAGDLSPLFTTTEATVTTTPALSFALNTQSANLIFAGPTSGAAVAPTFRALVTADLPDDGVTNAKLANVATQTFRGRNTAGTGDPEDLSVATAKTMLGLTGTNSGDQTITLTGDVTGSGTGSFAATISADAVTYAKMQNVSAASKLLGRGDGGSGDPQEITLGSGLSMAGTTLSASAVAQTCTFTTRSARR
jgi:hypothetical protein